MNKLRMQFTTALLALAFFAPSLSGQAVKSEQQRQPATSKKAQQTAEKTSKTAGQPEAWKKIPVPPLPPFKPAQPKRVQLSNGMVIFLQENHELPLIELATTIRGGSRLEPAEKVGLVDIYGEVWRTGGTTKRTGDEMDDFLEARAAKLETDGGGTSTSVSFSCLKQDFADVFGMYVELLREPAFREDKIKLAKDQARTSISRRNDDSDSIAGREAARLVYGKQSPFARIAEYATVDAITREDLVNWHREYVQPDNIIIGVTGDFNAAEMENRLKQAFESWPAGNKAKQPDIPVPGPKPAIYFVEKEDVNQSEIRILGIGIERSNPDYFAVSVMNEILGGGFASRLFTNLRTKKGLAYSVGGGVGSAWDHPGMLQLTMGTKSESTVAAIQGLYDEVDDLLKNPATDAELKRAKDSILNSFIFNFDHPEKVVRERMTYEFYGFPLDFLERYRAGVEKVTAEDVAQAARKYIHKEQLAALVVGNSSEFGQPLTMLGQVIPLDITIPTPGAGKASTTGAAAGPAAPKATNPEGKALIDKVVAFLGGEQKLKSVKSIRQKLTSVRKTPQGELPIAVDQTIVYPDRLIAVASVMGMELKNVVTPQGAFMASPQGVREFSGRDKDEAQRSLLRDVLNVAQHANDPSWVFAANGKETIGNREASVLDVAHGDFNIRWYIDPATGEVLQTFGESLGQTGPVQRTTQYSNWKDNGGLKLYSERKVMENGEPVATDTIEQWTVNPQVDPNSFSRPSTPAAPPQQ